MSGRLVLVRHGQSHSNVERRLDTRPPGRELTDLGREQARIFGRVWPHDIGMVAHSIAVRATQTAAEIGEERGLAPLLLDDIHEAQVGDLEDRNDDAAIEEFRAVYHRWHEGDLDARLPGGESGREVLDRYVPVLTQLRMRYLDDDSWRGDVVVVSHGAGIRLTAATLAGVEAGFALDHHLGNAESVVLAPITDGRWSCLHWGALSPPFYPEPESHPVEDALSVGRPDGLSAAAADRLAVDGERMHDLGHGAALIGAFRPLQRVMDDGAVAVVESGSTPPTVVVHGPFIALWADNPWLPRLRPAEFVQTIVVDAEVVGDLVDDGDGHLVDHLLLRPADVQDGVTIDGDLVG